MIAIMSLKLIEAIWTNAGHVRTLTTGDTLFRLGDCIHAMFLVKHGLVHLTRSLAHGGGLTLQRAGPGQILAEASLYADRYHCNAVAADASFVRQVSCQHVEALFAAEPALARAWSAHLAREVQRGRWQAETLAMKTVAERLNAWLAVNGGDLPPRGTWRQVSTEIGVTPEALYRELATRRGA